VDPAGEPAAGVLARVLPQRLFGQVPTLLNEVEDIDSIVRTDFLGFVLLISDISRFNRYSTQQTHGLVDCIAVNVLR